MKNLQHLEICGKELLDNNLNLIYNVGMGSKNEPYLISLFYKGDPSNEKKVISLIGKGVCFDSGGFNLKPTGFIENMYYDKSGACAVLSAFKGAVDLKLKINLSCTVAMAEVYYYFLFFNVI